jgi:hypothetical protein
LDDLSIGTHGISRGGATGVFLGVGCIYGKKTMNGIDDLMAQSNDRWADAMRRAQGVEDNSLSEAVKTYYTRYFPA